LPKHLAICLFVNRCFKAFCRPLSSPPPATDRRVVVFSKNTLSSLPARPPSKLTDRPLINGGFARTLLLPTAGPRRSISLFVSVNGSPIAVIRPGGGGPGGGGGGPGRANCPATPRRARGGGRSEGTNSLLLRPRSVCAISRGGGYNRKRFTKETQVPHTIQ